MSSDWKHLASQLTHDLDLSGPPIQVSYLEHAPAGMTAHPGGAPSVCTFFAEGQQRPFYAELKEHEACEIGAFVLGVAPEGEVGARLMGTVGMMQKEGYLNPGDEGKIPRNAKPPKFVAYGPLGTLPIPPTTVLMFANPRTSMLALEAAGGTVPMNGRPMCAIVPTLNNGAPVAMSMGCIGSRIYTQMGDDRMVVGVRGDHVEKFAAEVHRIRHANDVVGVEDNKRRTAAAHPYSKP
jgi:uncharacterized protein (DUF169 family)